MNFISQKNPLWADKKIGDSSCMMRNYGCLISCVSMCLDITPLEVLAKGTFYNGYISDHNATAVALGTSYNSERTKPLYDPAICEVKFDGAQHFVVKYQGKIYDPLSLDGTPLRNYTIISYRNYKPKEIMIPKSKTMGRMFDCEGKLLWWIPEPADLSYFEGTDGAKPITDISPVQIQEKIVEKPVDRPETLLELEKVRNELVEANSKAKQRETELSTCESIKEDLLKQKSDWLREMADYDKKYILIPRDLIKKGITKLTNLINKIFNNK